MKTIDQTDRLSDDQIVERYADSLQGEFERTEEVDISDEPKGESESSYSTQIVAPWDGQTHLQNSDFFRVKFKELNAAGLAFWIGEPPTTPYFAVIFEANGETVILRARVVESSLDSTLGSTMYLVATEFSGKVDMQNAS